MTSLGDTFKDGDSIRWNGDLYIKFKSKQGISGLWLREHTAEIFMMTTRGLMTIDMHRCSWALKHALDAIPNDLLTYKYKYVPIGSNMRMGWLWPKTYYIETWINTDKRDHFGMPLREYYWCDYPFTEAYTFNVDACTLKEAFGKRITDKDELTHLEYEYEKRNFRNSGSPKSNHTMFNGVMHVLFEYRDKDAMIRYAWYNLHNGKVEDWSSFRVVGAPLLNFDTDFINMHHIMDVMQSETVAQWLRDNPIPASSQLAISPPVPTAPVRDPRFPDAVADEPLVEDNDNLCTICLSRRKVVCCVPCGHQCACVTCCREIKTKGAEMKCPVCRASVEKFIRVY